MEEMKHSIKPSIQEAERFILFLNDRFKLGLQADLVVNIQETSSKVKGFFMPKEHPKHYTTDSEGNPLNYICLSSHFLKSTPYETIAHELAHYINHIEGFPAKNNYHHKHFKAQAEALLLKVSKGNHGYNFTEETEEFKQMLVEFKPSPNAFAIFQHTQEKGRAKTRNLLFVCDCGVKIRSAKNEDKPLMATCGYCGGEFKQQGDNDSDEGKDFN